MRLVVIAVRLCVMCMCDGVKIYAVGVVAE